MRAGARWALAGALTAALGIAGYGAWAGVGKPTAARGERAAENASTPLAVVLDGRDDASRLVVVDLARRKVVRRVALRSFVSDIALEPGSGTVVAAQSGGIGDKADRGISLTDPRTGRVRYVELPFPDPVNVVCVGGRAYVQHGLLQAPGLVVSVVDVAEGRVVRSGHVPDGPGLWTEIAGGIWESVADADGRWALVRIEPSTLTTTLVGVGGFRTLGMTDVGQSVLLAGSSAGGSGSSAMVMRISRAGGRVESQAVTVPGLRHPATTAVIVVGSIVVSDWTGEPPETGALAVLDPSTLRGERTLTGLGVPCAIAPWRDRVVTVDRVGGRLLVVDPATGRVDAAIDLGSRDMAFSDVVVVDPETR